MRLRPGPAARPELLCDKLTDNLSHKQWHDWVSAGIPYIVVRPLHLTESPTLSRQHAHRSLHRIFTLCARSNCRHVALVTFALLPVPQCGPG